MPSMNHTHCYERVKGKPKIYRCIHPDCSHYKEKSLLKGKRALCLCGNKFILSSSALRLKTPHCFNCVLRGAISSEPTPSQIGNVLSESIFEPELPIGEPLEPPANIEPKKEERKEKDKISEDKLTKEEFLSLVDTLGTSSFDSFDLSDKKDEKYDWEKDLRGEYDI